MAQGTLDSWASRLVDSNMAYMSIGGCECNQCRYVGKSGLSCRAFQSIPIAILTGKVKHRKPYPGDHGIQFDPR